MQATTHGKLTSDGTPAILIHVVFAAVFGGTKSTSRVRRRRDQVHMPGIDKVKTVMKVELTVAAVFNVGLQWL